MRTISFDVEDSVYDRITEMLQNEGQTKQAFYENLTKTAVRLKRIPFLIEDPVDTDPFYSESNMERLRHSFKQAEEGKVFIKTMEELEAHLVHLDLLLQVELEDLELIVLLLVELVVVPIAVTDLVMSEEIY